MGGAAMRTYQDELSHSRARHCACMTMCQHSRDSLFRGRASWRPCPPAPPPPSPPRCLPSSCLRRASVASGGVAAFGCLRPHVRPAARFVCPEIVGAASVENAPTPPRGGAGGSWDDRGAEAPPRTRVSDSDSYLILIHDVELEETHMAPTVAGLSLSLFFRSDVAAAASHGAHGAVSSARRDSTLGHA